MEYFVVVLGLLFFMVPLWAYRRGLKDGLAQPSLNEYLQGVKDGLKLNSGEAKLEPLPEIKQTLEPIPTPFDYIERKKEEKEQKKEAKKIKVEADRIVEGWGNIMAYDGTPQAKGVGD